MSPKGICSECNENSSDIQRLQKHYCRLCWINACNLRFRKRLHDLGKPERGKNLFQPGESISGIPQENILIYYDASDSGKALLRLIRESIEYHIRGGTGVHGQRLGKLPYPFSYTILLFLDGITDDGRISSSDDETSIHYIHAWLEQTKRKLPLYFPFPLVVTSLEKSLYQVACTSKSPSTLPNEEMSKNFVSSKEIKDEVNWSSGERTQYYSLERPSYDLHLQNRLQQILQSMKSRTSRIDLIRCLRQRVVLSVAKELGLAKILLSEDQTTLAINMFSLMSTGRGAQLGDQMNLVSQIGGVHLCRPLMDFSSDDLRDYSNVLDNIELCWPPVALLNIQQQHIDKKPGRIDSIRRQCEEFIVTLQQDYPGTVPTLTRIGGKIVPPPSILGSNSMTMYSDKLNCKLCQYTLTQLDSGDLCYGCQRLLKDSSPLLLEELLT